MEAPSVPVCRFVIAEKRAEAPIISFRMFANRLYTASIAAAFFYGSAFVIATVYVPIFIQGVFGGSATGSGTILMPMLITGVLFSQIGGGLTPRFSYRSIMIGSALLLMAGMYLLSRLSPELFRPVVTVFMIVTGMGIGVSMSVLMQSAEMLDKITNALSTLIADTFLWGIVPAVLAIEFSRNHERFRAWIEQARDSNLRIMKKVEEYAKKRGEIAHDFTEMQMSLPFDLLRVENVIRHEKITEEYLTQLVDEVLLPVYLGKCDRHDDVHGHGLDET